MTLLLPDRFPPLSVIKRGKGFGAARLVSYLAITQREGGKELRGKELGEKHEHVSSLPTYMCKS